MSSFYYWRKGELTIKDWFKSIQGKKFFAVYSFKDPLPFLAEIDTAIKVIFNGLFTRLFKSSNNYNESLNNNNVSSSVEKVKS